ncbi:MAG: MFS transporter [Nostoc sp.]|uniref:MFS transporter n=1 Tax=Nostoc sp. TaxID=1180 RepID=UPI002FF3B1F6
MRTFIIVWLGQAGSIIGSEMTAFAFTIWVWELTGQATALALFGLFVQVPQILIIPIAGVVVDRFHRKYLMIAGDTVSGLCTITILVLYVNNNLQLWHLYVAVAIVNTFAPFQKLAFSASTSVLVPKQHYSRVSSLNFISNSSSYIIAPALAGVLYPEIGLIGILIIDIATFVLAVTTVLLVHIPQPSITEVHTQSRTSFKQDLVFGWHYITKSPSLFAMLILASLYSFVMSLLNSLYTPMILARTGDDTRVIGTVSSASGLGGIIGASLIGIWGGPKRRIHGWLMSMAGTGLSETVFSLGTTPLIWISAQFCSSLNYPLLGISSDAIWLAKIRPEILGRIFATRSVVMLVTSTVATLIAGSLADYVFEPAMMPEGSLAPILGWMVGTGRGAGMALLYVISSLGLLLLGLGGYLFRTLRNVEIIVPDHDASTK